jgi:AcrR family transcriptional regulator
MKHPEPQPIRQARRREQAETRREQLLAVALDVFFEKGIGEATTRDIARRAGITEGLIYHYFPSKSALLQAVMEKNAPDKLAGPLLATVGDLPVREAFVNLGLGILALMEHNRKFITVVLTETQRGDDVVETASRLLGNTFRAGAAFVQSRIDNGELLPHEPLLTIRLFHGGLLFYFLMQDRLGLPLPEGTDRRGFVEGTVNILLAGILAKHEARETGEGNEEETDR